MDRNYDFLLSSTDPDVNGFLKSLAGENEVFVRRFTQEEELFLTLPSSFTVPSFAIHHDVHSKKPSDRYLAMIKTLCEEWGRRLPGVFSGLNWFFDPRDIFHPLFLQILNFRDKRYLYVLKVDLTFRSRHGRVIARGSNDYTPSYQTQQLFLESEVLPLDKVETLQNEKQLYLAKLFSNTWKGESGRGYFVTGHWIDQEITKFLSRTALPTGQRTFPFYPFRCRYNTISSTCVHLSPDGRKRSAALLEGIWSLLAKEAVEIQRVLKESVFSEDLPLFKKFHELAPPELAQKLGKYRLEPYLNEADQKEFIYHGELE